MILAYAYSEGTSSNDDTQASIIDSSLVDEPATFKLYTRCVLRSFQGRKNTSKCKSEKDVMELRYAV